MIEVVTVSDWLKSGEELRINYPSKLGNLNSEFVKVNAAFSNSSAVYGGLVFNICTIHEPILHRVVNFFRREVQLVILGSGNSL